MSDTNRDARVRLKLFIIDERVAALRREMEQREQGLASLQEQLVRALEERAEVAREFSGQEVYF